MKITQQNNFNRQQRQNFTGVNLIQISKKAFQTPNDAYITAMDFSREVNKITKEWPDSVTKLFGKLGLEKFVTKTISCLEQPLYVNLVDHAKRNGAGVSWLAFRTQIPIKPPLSEDYHSFYLYTKKHKNQVADIINPNHYKRYSGSAIQQGLKLMEANPDRKSVIESPLWIETKLNDIFVNEFDKVAQGEPLQQFKIENFSELPNVFKQIAY